MRMTTILLALLLLAPLLLCAGDVLLRGHKLGHIEWSGEVEVYWEGRWRRVCGDNFTETEATVTCWDADPELPHATLLQQSSAFEDSHPLPTTTITTTTTTTTAVVSVSCTGSEVTINHCAIVNATSCPSGHFAYVLCSSTPPVRPHTERKFGLDMSSVLGGILWTVVVLTAVVMLYYCFACVLSLRYSSKSTEYLPFTLQRGEGSGLTSSDLKSKKTHSRYRSTHRSYYEGQRQVQTNYIQVQTSQRQVQPQETYNCENLKGLGGDRSTEDTLKEMTAVQAATAGNPGPRFPNAPPPREIRI